MPAQSIGTALHSRVEVPVGYTRRGQTHTHKGYRAAGGVRGGGQSYGAVRTFGPAVQGVRLVVDGQLRAAGPIGSASEGRAATMHGRCWVGAALAKARGQGPTV